MEFKKINRHLIVPFLFLSVPIVTIASTHNFQIEIMGGFNHSYSPESKLYIKSDTPGVPTEVDTLHDTSSGNDFIGGAGLSYILPLADDKDDFMRDLLIGLDLYFFNTTRSGEVYLFEDPNANNLDYDLKLKTSRLMLNGELDFFSPWKRLAPYLQGSIGVARVEASYHDYPIGETIGGGIRLSEKTNYNFAYSLGAGVKYNFIEDFQLSISYLYTDLGDVETSTKSGDQVILTQPTTDRLRTSSGLVGLSYLFG
ncbi:MAG: outer membrane protein [Gammaproteobacteria bacterium]